MTGLLVWNREQRGRPSVTAEEISVLRVRFFKVELTGTAPEYWLRRRVRRAARLFERAGVARVVLPPEFPYTQVLERQGLRPVSTRMLRQDLAADWVRAALAERGLLPGSARVIVAADRLTGEVVQTVTELALRHRYVLLDLPRGGEELCRRLRREYGVTPVLAPAREQVEEAEAAVLFHEREMGAHPVTLRLYDEGQPLPYPELPPALERQLPAGADRAQLLAALRDAGALKRGQITLRLFPE